jgi:CMP/dCMP kinase
VRDRIYDVRGRGRAGAVVVVAIDGPAGAGKSTVARALAAKLGFAYLDSGAMYRCVALAALQRGGDALPERPGALGELARALTIELCAAEPNGGAGERVERVRLDGREVGAAIRSPEVSEAASVVAADPAVRAAIVAKQRELLAAGDWVAEGRDIGTVVAPDAALKVFLTADPRERARRRAAELDVDPELVLAEQALRDERDRTRAHSPLQPAADAVALDTSGVGVAEVVERIAALIAGH